MKSKLVLSLTLFVSLLSACNRTSKLDGEVFIATQGAGNYKLGAVEIRVIPEKETKKFLESKTLKVESPGAKCGQAYANLKVSYNDARSAYLDALARWEASIERLKRDYSAAAYSADFYQKQTEEKSEQVASLEQELAPLTKECEPLSNIKFYFDDLPKGVTTTTSNSEGKFTLTVPARGKYAIAARAHRKTLTGTEEYYWFFWVDAEEDTRQVNLNNQNLVTTDSPDSVVPNRASASL